MTCRDSKHGEISDDNNNDDDDVWIDSVISRCKNAVYLARTKDNVK